MSSLNVRTSTTAILANAHFLLDAAERKFEELTVRLGYITETIEHYDFYKWCWEQEEEQAMGYADFYNHLS